MVWLKLVHIAALAIWCAALFFLPVLFAARRRVATPRELWRLQRFVHDLYIKVGSSAAFATIVSGIGLIFLREAYTPWLAAKLALVGVMALIHIRHGYIISKLFEKGRNYAPWRMAAALTTTTLAVGGVLALALAKPEPPRIARPDWLAPGGLQSLFDAAVPTP